MFDDGLGDICGHRSSLAMVPKILPLSVSCLTDYIFIEWREKAIRCLKGKQGVIWVRKKNDNKIRRSNVELRIPYVNDRL